MGYGNMYTLDRSYVSKLNDHVDQCQICQKGTLCDIAEQIISDEERRQAQLRKERRERQIRQAGL